MALVKEMVSQGLTSETRQVNRYVLDVDNVNIDTSGNSYNDTMAMTLSPFSQCRSSNI